MKLWVYSLNAPVQYILGFKAVKGTNMCVLKCIIIIIIEINDDVFGKFPLRILNHSSTKMHTCVLKNVRRLRSG